MTESIQIDTGEKRLAIWRDGDQVGELVFNPKDTLFMERLYKLFIGVTEGIRERLNIEETDQPKQIEIIKDVNVFVRQQIDSVFGEGKSQMLFGDTVSYDMGIYTQFIEQIQGFIKPVRKSAVSKYIPTVEKPVMGARAKPKKPHKRK
jgi:hypothetical protein